MDDNKVTALSLGKKYKRVYGKCLAKANRIALDKRKVGKYIKKSRRIFEKLHNVHRFEKLSKHICDFCDLLSDYCDDVYTNLPVATLIALVGGILYLVLPIDVLADFIPFLGWLDDAAVLNFVIKTEQNDINEYLHWKEANFLNHACGEQENR